MGATATTCPICSAPASIDDHHDEAIPVPDTVVDRPDESTDTDEPIVSAQDTPDHETGEDHEEREDLEDHELTLDLTDDVDEPAEQDPVDTEPDMVDVRERASTTGPARRGDGAVRVPADPVLATVGRTRPKTPLRPYVPPESALHTQEPTSADQAIELEPPRSSPPVRGGGARSTPAPLDEAVPPPARSGWSAPAVTPPGPLPPGSVAPAPGRPGARDSAPVPRAWPDPQPGAWPATSAAVPAAPPPQPVETDEQPRDRRRTTTRVLLVLLVAMVGVGLWLQWDRIGELFDGDEQSSPAAVTEVGPHLDETGTAQAPVVEGRLERNVGSFVTQVTLESITT